MTKLIVTFLNFEYVPKKLTFSTDFWKEINHILDPIKQFCRF